MATTVAILATTVATTVVIDSLCEVTKAGLHERPWLLDIDAARCPLLAQSRHHHRADPCPLLGVKRTFPQLQPNHFPSAYSPWNLGCKVAVYQSALD